MSNSSVHRARFLQALLIVAIGVLAYSRVFTAGFIWDDPQYIINNFELRDLRGLFDIWFHPMSLPQWYPLVHTTFWIEYHLWGLAPAGYHIVNVALHLTNAMLVWRLLKKLNVPGAWLAAAIFAVHPIAVESVAWITERKNVLSLFFYLLALQTYLHTLAKPSPRGWVFSFLFFTCALFSKTVTATLPCAILVIIWWKNNRIRGRDVVPLIPFFIVGIVMSSFTSWLEVHHVGADGSKIVELNFNAMQRIFIAGRAVWFYAGKILWPANLVFIYPRWISMDQMQPWLWIFPIALIGLLIAMLMLRNKIGRGALAAVLLFCGTLAPALGFVAVYPMRFSFVADHFQYHACIALIALIAAGIRRFACISNRANDPTFTAVRWIVLGTLTFLTIQQTTMYHDPLSLWSETAKNNPASWMAFTNLGNALNEVNETDQADLMYLKALELAPNLHDTHANAGNVFARRGDFARAIAEFTEAIQLDPNFAPAYVGWGQVLEHQSQLDDAQSKYEQAVTLAPHYFGANFRMAMLLEKRGDRAGAVEHYRAAIASAPEIADARLRLGSLLLEMNQLDESLGNLFAAVQLDPKNADTWTKLGESQLRSGHVSDAITSFQTALKLRTGFAPAAEGLRQARANSPR